MDNSGAATLQPGASCATVNSLVRENRARLLSVNRDHLTFVRSSPITSAHRRPLPGRSGTSRFSQTERLSAWFLCLICWSETLRHHGFPSRVLPLRAGHDLSAQRSANRPRPMPRGQSGQSSSEQHAEPFSYLLSSGPQPAGGQVCYKQGSELGRPP